MLSAGLNIVGFSWITSPAATELEMIVVDWLAKMLNLPDGFISAGKGQNSIFLTRECGILSNMGMWHSIKYIYIYI